MEYYFAGIPTRGTPYASMQVEGLARPCHGYLCLASQSGSLAGWCSFRCPFTRLSLTRQRARQGPNLLLFCAKATPQVQQTWCLITVANRGSPSSALCTLCLQQRRDACESRSRRTQGVPVYTEYLWTVSTLGSIHAMPDMPATPKRHARLICGFGLMPAHITERHSQQLHPVKLCHLRPPSFLRVRSAVSPD